MTRLFGSRPWQAIASLADDGGVAGPVTAEPWDAMQFLDRPSLLGTGPARRSAVNPDQFAIFQFADDPLGGLLDVHDAAPSLAGSDAAPDVKLRVQLNSFHIGAHESIESAERATIRLDLAQRDTFDRVGDLLCWSAATALTLIGEDKRRSPPEHLTSDISRAFGPRPIEISGGLGEFRFEVVAHREPPWWRRIFHGAAGPAATTLGATLGFPGITFGAVALLDEFFERLSEVENKPLFQSQPLVLAFSGRARREFTQGVPGIRIGVLNKGFYLLCRHRDVAEIREMNPVYLASAGILVPKGTEIDRLHGQDHVDPFRDMTYAVLRVASTETSLKPEL